MTKFKFTSGTLSKDSFDYYTLVLMNNEKVVYRATVDRLEAACIINKYNKIKLV